MFIPYLLTEHLLRIEPSAGTEDTMCDTESLSLKRSYFGQGDKIDSETGNQTCKTTRVQEKEWDLSGGQIIKELCLLKIWEASKAMQASELYHWVSRRTTGYEFRL